MRLTVVRYTFIVMYLVAMCHGASSSSSCSLISPLPLACVLWHYGLKVTHTIVKFHVFQQSSIHQNRAARVSPLLCADVSGRFSFFSFPSCTSLSHPTKAYAD